MKIFSKQGKENKKRRQLQKTLEAQKRESN